MSLEHILGIAPRPRNRAERMQAQIDTLGRDLHQALRALSGSAEHRAAGLGDLAGTFGREAAQHTAHLAGEVSRRANRGMGAVRRDPVPAIAVLGTALLLASLLHRRR